MTWHVDSFRPTAGCAVFVALMLTFVSALAGCRGQAGSAPQQASAGTPDTFAPFSFVLAGDPQMGFSNVADDSAQFAEFRDAMNLLKPAFILQAGDAVHNNTSEEWAALDNVLAGFEPKLHHARGNHDAGPEWEQRFGKDHYAFDYNDCAFIVANSNVLRDPNAAGYAEQWAWLEQAAQAASGRKYAFLLIHHPPFIESEQEGDEYFNWTKAERAKLLAICRANGIDMILSGHLHRSVEARTADGAVTIYSASGSAKAFDERLAYRYFTVSADGVSQKLVDYAAQPAR